MGTLSRFEREQAALQLSYQPPKTPYQLLMKEAADRVIYLDEFEFAKPKSDSADQTDPKGTRAQAGGLSKMSPEQERLIAVLDKVLGLIDNELYGDSLTPVPTKFQHGIDETFSKYRRLFE